MGDLISSDMTSLNAKDPAFEASLEEAALAKIRMESSRAACVPVFEREARVKYFVIIECAFECWYSSDLLVI